MVTNQKSNVSLSFFPSFGFLRDSHFVNVHFSARQYPFADVAGVRKYVNGGPREPGWSTRELTVHQVDYSVNAAQSRHKTISTFLARMQPDATAACTLNEIPRTPLKHVPLLSRREEHQKPNTSFLYLAAYEGGRVFTGVCIGDQHPLFARL